MQRRCYNADMEIRPYRGADEEALLELWNLAMPADAIDQSTFRTKVLLDANFRPGGLLLAEEEAGLGGFVLSLTRQVPLFLQGLEPELGWITAFGVHPGRRRRGLGRALFDAAEDRMAGLGRRSLLISPYTPNYLIPGVDTAAYPEAMGFLQSEGWQVRSRPISMHADLTGSQIPPHILDLERQLAEGEGVRIRPVRAADLPDLLPFVSGTFGWDWFRLAQQSLLEMFGRGSDELAFLVAEQGGRIVGYCQQRRERFGPFGVAPEMRGKGIGRVLLFRCLAIMQTRGFHCAWFLWTGSDAARLYSLAGFRQVRQFAVMHKSIG